MTTTNPEKNWFWPILICSLIFGHMFAASVMAYVATRDPSFAVEPDYYQEAIDWDKSRAQERENARLGWSAAITVGDPMGPLAERAIACRLRDKQSAAIDEAVVDMVAFAHARGGDRVTLVLAGQGGGEYQATARLPRTGLWEFRLVVKHKSEIFTHSEQLRVSQ